MKKVRFLGLDVHAETIAVAIAEPDGEVRSLGIIPNREESIRKLVKKLGPAEQLLSLIHILLFLRGIIHFRFLPLRPWPRWWRETRSC